jgi:uncharacterized protein YdaU (DUF1376 family)
MLRHAQEMKTMEWYRHNSNAFSDGVIELTLEEIGAYILILDAIYARDGILPNNDEVLRKILRCDIRKAKRLKNSLFVKGKLRLERNLITNLRATSEIKLAQSLSKVQGERAKKRWKNNGNSSAENGSALNSNSNGLPSLEGNGIAQNNEFERLKAAEKEFEIFWAEYPKRDGANPKQPAFKSWISAVKAGADPAAIIAGIRLYARNPNTKPGTPYVPMASTWLNQKRWTDETEKAAAGPSVGAWKLQQALERTLAERREFEASEAAR